MKSKEPKKKEKIHKEETEIVGPSTRKLRKGILSY